MIPTSAIFSNTSSTCPCQNLSALILSPKPIYGNQASNPFLLSIALNLNHHVPQILPITLLSIPQANPFLPHPHLHLTPHNPYRYAGLVSDPHLYLNFFQIWRALTPDRFCSPNPPLPPYRQFLEESRAAIAEHMGWVALYGWLFQLLISRRRCWGLGGFKRFSTWSAWSYFHTGWRPQAWQMIILVSSSRHGIEVRFNRPQPQQMSHAARDCILDIP